MKGPHFFEKRKKEMARQEKLKQKADRKAQRKAGKGTGEEGVDEFADIEGLNAGMGAESAPDGGGEAGASGEQQPAEDRPTPSAGVSDDQARGS